METNSNRFGMALYPLVPKINSLLLPVFQHAYLKDDDDDDYDEQPEQKSTFGSLSFLWSGVELRLTLQ